MPKGQPMMTWNAENDQKLAHAILTVHRDFKPDFAAIAREFGPNIPASCIATRIRRLRKEADEASNTTNSASAVPGRAGTGVKVPKEAQSMSKRKIDNNTDTVDSSANEGAQTGLQAPDHEIKRQKVRSSPRDLGRKDYKASNDPYATIDAVDADGNSLFEKGWVLNKDSADSDEDYVDDTEQPQGEAV